MAIWEEVGSVSVVNGPAQHRQKRAKVLTAALKCFLSGHAEPPASKFQSHPASPCSSAVVSAKPNRPRAVGSAVAGLLFTPSLRMVRSSCRDRRVGGWVRKGRR